METQIARLSERLESDQAWNQVTKTLDQRLNTLAGRSVAEITSYFAHEENLTRRMNQMGWLSLELQTLYFFRELDSSGLSEIVGRLAPEYLADFSYREALEFRSLEEKLVPELEIPDQAWEIFWQMLDHHKGEFVSQMRTYRPYSFYKHLYPLIEREMHKPPERFRHLSPFRWSKAVAAGIGTVLGIADTMTAVLTLPFGGGIAIASILGAGVSAGYIVGAEK